MRSIKPALILTLFLIILFISSMASADGRHWGGGHYRGSRVGVGVVIGGPIWGPSWYYPHYYPYSPYSPYSPYYPSYPYYYPYYYPPAVVVPSTPPTYIERSEPESSSTTPGVWYYCPDSKNYYPYVKECPGGWQKVPAQPPSGQAR
jgi:hypothetical protein